MRFPGFWGFLWDNTTLGLEGAHFFLWASRGRERLQGAGVHRKASGKGSGLSSGLVGLLFHLRPKAGWGLAHLWAAFCISFQGLSSPITSSLTAKNNGNVLFIGSGGQKPRFSIRSRKLRSSQGHDSLEGSRGESILPASSASGGSRPSLAVAAPLQCLPRSSHGLVCVRVFSSISYKYTCHWIYSPIQDDLVSRSLT